MYSFNFVTANVCKNRSYAGTGQYMMFEKLTKNQISLIPLLKLYHTIYLLYDEFVEFAYLLRIFCQYILRKLNVAFIYQL